MEKPIHIYLFGNLRVVKREGDTVTDYTKLGRRRKVGHLIAQLACHIGGPHKRETLRAMIWGQGDVIPDLEYEDLEYEDTKHDPVPDTIHEARNVLGDALVGDTDVTLNSDKVWTDVADFNQTWNAAKTEP